MRIYLDTAKLADIQWAVDAGLIDGVTTTPTSLGADADNRDHKLHLAEICRALAGPVAAEVVSVDAEGMYREGRELAKIADTIVVSVPMLEEGLMATRRLAADGIRVNMTLIFTAAQALLAAKAGASSVSPFLGNLEDIGGDSVAVLHDIRVIFDIYRVECDILAAAIRNPLQFTQAAKVGVEAATLPPALLRALLVHPLTDRGVDQFLNDWSKRLVKTRAGA